MLDFPPILLYLAMKKSLSASHASFILVSSPPLSKLGTSDPF